MAYNKKQLYEDALEITKNEDIYFIQDIIDSLGISRPTFYDHFPVDSDKFNIIKRNIYKNRIKKKLELRNKLTEGKGSELIALYKLISSDEERLRLSVNYLDHKSSDGSMTPKIVINVDNEEVKNKLDNLLNEH